MGLFSKKKKDADANPYAGQVPFSNPLTPYQQARNDMAQAKATGLPSNPRVNSMSSNGNGTPPPAYQTQPSSGSTRFGADKYGSQNGYGSDPYGGNASSSTPARGAGGYGGFDDDAGKGDLFGAASGRYVPPQENNAAAPDPGRPTNKNPALFGNAPDRYDPYATQAHPHSGAPADEYDGYGAPRELTAEEQEEQEVQAIKDETKALRKEGLASVNRSIGMANTSLDTVFGTRLRLAEQEERLHNTEVKLDVADIHTKDGTTKTKELDKLNRTPFFIPVGPGKKARNKEVEATMARHREERERREETRRDGFGLNQRMEETTKELTRSQPKQLLGANSQPVKSKFLLEDDDEEDVEDEKEMNAGIKSLEGLTSQLKVGARLIGEDIDRSNERLARIAQKTDVVDDRVRLNRAKLQQIR